MKIVFHSKKITLTLLAILCVLLLAHLSAMYYSEKLGISFVASKLRHFNFDVEMSLPTVFSVVILFMSSALLYVIFNMHRSTLEGKYWGLLSAIFLFLAFDEWYQIHEPIGGYLTSTFHTSGFFYYAWIIPYGLVTLALAAFYVRFLFRLELKTRLAILCRGYALCVRCGGTGKCVRVY